MDQTLHTNPPEVYDFRQYDRIWQRVAPGLEPYPAARQEAQNPAAPVTPVRPVTPAAPAAPSVPAAPAQPPFQQESQLPGAEPNPCCMGSAAADMLDVLTGFAGEALEEQRQLQALARQAPSWARQRLREMAAEKGGQARRLAAVVYLITGSCYRPTISVGRILCQGWCAALRERYHAAACDGFNYARASEGTTDPCLTRLLEDLSGESYGHADALLAMLERSLRM